MVKEVGAVGGIIGKTEAIRVIPTHELSTSLINWECTRTGARAACIMHRYLEALSKLRANNLVIQTESISGEPYYVRCEGILYVKETASFRQCCKCSLWLYWLMEYVSNREAMRFVCSSLRGTGRFQVLMRPSKTPNLPQQHQSLGRMP